MSIDQFVDVGSDVWEPVTPDTRSADPGLGSWTELSPELVELRSLARHVADTELRPYASRWDENEEFPHRSLDKIRQAGLLGLTVPVEYGGRGLGYLAGCVVVEELATACLASAMSAQPFLNGPWRAVYVLGTEEQKHRILPGVAAGTRHFAIAMSEPGAGTAGTDLRTQMRPDGDGGYRLHGLKSWVTGGREADTMIVFARLPGTTGPRGIGAVLIDNLDKTRPAGMSEPHIDPKMGIRGVAECTFEFTDVRIDADNVLIIPDADSKKGASILVEQFNPERCGNAAMCTGLAQAALDASIAHLKARNQFGRPLADFQGLQWKIADMALQVEISRTLTWKAARAGDTSGGFPPQHDTVLAKLHSSEMVQTVTNHAIQIHGARGYSRRWPLERLFRDGRGLAIGGGTTEVMRNMLAGIVLDRRTSQRGARA